MNIYQHRRDRLLALIEAEYGGERVRFANQTELSESRLAQLLSENYRGGEAFTEKTARKVERAAGLPPMYFDQGAAPGSPAPALMPVEIHHAGNPNIVLIPKVQLRATAGITGFAVDGTDDVNLDAYPLERSWVERNGFSQQKLIAMRVKGDSMFPLYREGDVIVINTADIKPVDTKEYVVNFDGDVVLKRLSRDSGSWWLTSDNPEPKYHRRSVRSGETIIIGRVVKHDRTDL